MRSNEALPLSCFWMKLLNKYRESCWRSFIEKMDIFGTLIKFGGSRDEWKEVREKEKKMMKNIIIHDCGEKQCC